MPLTNASRFTSISQPFSARDSSNRSPRCSRKMTAVSVFRGVMFGGPTFLSPGALCLTHFCYPLRRRKCLSPPFCTPPHHKPPPPFPTHPSLPPPHITT